MPGFDPDAFLAETAPAPRGAGGFDPDAFLANAAPAPAGPSQLESLGRGALQGGSLGFSDEIAGGVEAALERLRGAHEDLGKLYAKHRDESRAANRAAQTANPLTFGAGKIAGGLAPALLTSGATLPEQLVAGAAMGGLGNLGEAEKLDDKALAIVGEGAVGGALGAGLGNLAARGVGAVAKPAAEALEANAGGVGKMVEKSIHGLGHGGVAASLMHGNIPGVIAGLAAPKAAHIAGHAATSLAGSLGRVGKAVASNPALLGRYGAVLANAAKAGPEILHATHFALAQKDPEYQKKVVELQNEHSELDDSDTTTSG